MKVIFKPGDILLPISIPRNYSIKLFLIVRLIISLIKEDFSSVLATRRRIAIPGIFSYFDNHLLIYFRVLNRKMISR